VDAGRTNVVGTEEVVERLRRMIAEYRRHAGIPARRERHEGKVAFGGKAKSRKQKAKMRDEGTEGRRDQGGEESTGIDNQQPSSSAPSDYKRADSSRPAQISMHAAAELLRPFVPPSLRPFVPPSLGLPAQPAPCPCALTPDPQPPLGIPTGLDTLDAALPWGGLPRGAVSQILDGGPGVGTMSLALAVAGRAARGDDMAGPGWAGCGGVGAESARPIVVIDPAGDFYPPAVVKFGLDPQRLLLVRPKRAVDAVWAADQCLRCPAVAAVVARLERLGRVHSRRLQLAAEAGGGIGLVVTPLAGRERTFVAVAVALEAEVAFGDKTKSKKQKAKMRDEGTEGRRDGGEVAFGDKSKRGRDQGSDGSIAIDNPRSSFLRASVPSCLRASVSTPRPRLVRVTVLKVREGIPAEPFVVGLDDEAGFMPVHAVAEGGAAGAGKKRAGA